MNRIGLSFFLLLLIVLAFSQPDNNKIAYINGYLEADNLYHKAIDFASFPGNSSKSTEKEIIMRRQALAGFKIILPAIEKAHDDSLAFYCYYKRALLEHSLDSFANATLYYEKAIRLRGTKQPDSLSFRPYLFLGTIQYNSNQFDQALTSYKKAEAIAAKYVPGTIDAYQLYHVLGTMYYEMADYNEAINYFQKAVALVNKPGSPPDTLWTNSQLNLAAALMKLEKFNEANTICTELLKQDTSRNMLYMTAKVSLLLDDKKRAIDFLNRVNYNDHNRVRLLNELGLAYESMGHPDSARRYYLEAIKENSKWPGKNADAGLTLKYLGDFDTEVKSFNVALKKYQEAIIQFVPGFNDEDVYKNPEQFSGAFSYASLFNTLIAKARAFEKFYQRVNVNRKLEAALEAYRAAFRLADYVAQTYKGDDARLFLDKIKDTVRSHAIDLSLLLYEQTNQPGFLEEAYRFDQSHKISIYSKGTGHNEVSTGDSGLLAKEFSLRTAITRLSIKATETADSAARQLFTVALKDNEILLRKVQDELKKDPGYLARHPADNIPAIDELQKNLDRSTAVVSFHISENELLAFIITDDKFDLIRSPIAPGFAATLDSFKSSLHNVTAGNSFSATTLSAYLYNTLITPIRSAIAKGNRLVIIPDDELNDLPFEALRNKTGQYLIERFAVQYQYSTVLFNKQDLRDVQPDSTRLIIFNAYDEQVMKHGVTMKQPLVFSCTDCPGVITSLWKADSKTTSYITRRLDYYLKKGLSKDKALQKAKTDLLSNAEIDARFKSPVYWANLVYTGQYQPSSTLSLWWPLGSSVGVSFLIILLANLDSRRKRLKIYDRY